MLLGMFKFSAMELLVIQLNFRISYFSVRRKISKENNSVSKIIFAHYFDLMM